MMISFVRGDTTACSASAISASRAASSSTSSPRLSGWTPLSDRFHVTWFSYVDCIRSMAKDSSLITWSLYCTILASFWMTTAPSPNLARIPAGEFLMGAADADEDERPVHRVFVSEFFIGRFPVTHDEYGRFVRATGHPAP